MSSAACVGKRILTPKASSVDVIVRSPRDLRAGAPC